jgi:hypothetical protein
MTIRAIWDPMEFIGPLGESARCPLTLEGSFHARTIAKVAYALNGYITRAAVGVPASCTGSEATILQETFRGM